MSESLQKMLSLFFKYFENNDQDMMKLYYQLLSAHDHSFVKRRLMDLIATRDKSYKFPAVSEILRPLINSRKEHFWKLLNDHLKNPHESMPDHVFALKRFLEVPHNRTEYAMAKIKDQFFEHKYDEFKLYLEGEIKIPSLTAELRKYGIHPKDEIKQLESSFEQ